MEEPKSQTEEPRKRILVPTGKRYSGAAVERMIKEYKKRSRQDASKANKYKKMYEKTMARYLRVRESVKKTNKKVWFKIGRERGNHRVSIKRYEKKYQKLKEKYRLQQKKYRATIRKKIYKELKAKFKFYDPNQNINLNYVKTIIWARVYAKLSIVKRKTKLTPREIIAILFLSQYENGTTALVFRKEMMFSSSPLALFTYRLRKFGLVGVEKYSAKRHTYFLTDKGKRFADTILNFVKKEIDSTHVKKIKPKYIRGNVSAATTAASARTPKQQTAS
jgi:hypothetical protein